ncbi:MAG: T9SS type A sorting domain-containing protein [Chitinispirillaceae bacterium]|nr:T9SS type A sorting domain-containing protein [Chitinispirillaceae bacterium]
MLWAFPRGCSRIIRTSNLNKGRVVINATIRYLLGFLVAGVFATAGQASTPAWPSTIPKPADATVETKVNWIWHNVVKQTVTEGRGRGTYTNFIDQLHATAAMGKFQVCIRWDSRNENVSSTKRDEMEQMLQRHIKQWIDCLSGHDGWPWATVPLRISGWAGYTASNFGWTESDNGVPIYIGDTSFENAPQCPQTCGRFFHTDRNYTYPSCPGGAKNHYDWSSWHSYDDFGAGGHGSDWGQRTRTSALSRIDQQIMVISHEMGHGFYMPDFYGVSVPGGNPPMVMGAPPSGNQPSEYDRWLLRRIWGEMKRQSGRLPTVAVEAISSPSKPALRFSVTAKSGMIRIRATNARSDGFTATVFDPVGRMVASQEWSGTGDKVIDGHFAKGIYVVKITGKNSRETHRINIAR